jgi:DNA-binding MarR family transcriptional regulator
VERLLHFRETRPEQSIPPVLIVAQDARQAERWQETCREMAARLHTEPLEGAITLLPSEWSTLASWRLPWRRIGTGAFCHLPELVEPAETPAFSRLLEEPKPVLPTRSDGKAYREADRIWSVPVHTGRRSFGLVNVSAKRKGDARLACSTLVQRQWEILLGIYAHPLLSHDDLSALLSLHPRWVQRLVKDLAHKGFLQSTLTPIGERWQLAEAGLRLLARAANCRVARLAHLPDDPVMPVQQRGVLGLLHQIQHTAGVYGFFTTLAQALTARPDAGIRFWETGGACERVFVYREKTLHFKPDALACVHLGARDLRFWLEWDRGTMGARDLERKGATYATYLTSREWAREATTPPALVWVVSDIAQERRVIRVARALLAHVPALHLWTTTAGLLLTQSILAPIWQQIEWHAERSPPEASERRALFA